jgi:hypothetical protein
MDKETAIKVLTAWDEAGRYVFTRHDLAKLFPDDSAKTLQEAVNRLVKAGWLRRACRGVYVYALARSMDSHTIERIAVALRRGEYNYLSLESALSEYGTIEFTHTKRASSVILSSIRNVGRPLRLATPMAAWRDLKRVGRNTHLVNEEALTDD